MPPPISWFSRLDEIILAIEDAPLATWDRATLGELFNLGRTAAAQLLARIPGSFRAGRTCLVHKRELLLWLYQIKTTGAWENDTARRLKVLRAIEPERERLAQGGAPPDTVVARGRAAQALQETDADTLPGAIQLTPGRLTIEFYGWDCGTKAVHFAVQTSAAKRNYM